MIKRFAGTIALTLVVGFAAGCGGEDEEGEEGAGGSCGAAPAEIAQPPTLPDGFPTPEGVVYTSEREAGPSHIVEGYRDGELEDAFEAYKDAFDQSGYDVTKDEREEDDAEVNFAGGSSTGQVKLEQRCEDRTTVGITARPE
jgi:hypothetical protein